MELCCVQTSASNAPTISAWRKSRSSHAGHQHPPDNPLIPARFEYPFPPSVLTWSRPLYTRTVRGFTELIRRATQAMSSRGRSNIDPAGGQAYSAAAMSLVFHTASPLVPTFRADVRYLEVRWVGRVISVTLRRWCLFHPSMSLAASRGASSRI